MAAHESWLKDTMDAIGEMAEWKLPAAFSDRLARSATSSEMAAIIRETIASVPGFLDLPLHLMAQRLYSRGTGASRTIGYLIDLIPPLAEEVRQRTGVTEVQARQETARRFMEKYAGIRTNIAAIANGGPMAETTPTPAPAPGATPKPPAPTDSEISRVQRAVMNASDNAAFTPKQRQIILYMFRILRTEGSPGSDVVAELEGEARSGTIGLLDTLRHNAPEMRKLFDDLEPDVEMAYVSYLAMRDVEKSKSTTSTNNDSWREHAKDFVRRLMPLYEFLLIGHADRHPNTAVGSAAMDMLDRLNVFAKLTPSSAYERARAVKDAAVTTSRWSLALLAATVIYVLYVVSLAKTNPDELSAFAWSSTKWIVTGLSLTMIVGSFVSLPIAMAAVLALFNLAPIALTVAWVCTTVFSPTPDWSAWWLGLGTVLALDLVTLGIEQKFISTIGGIPEMILVFLKDSDKAKKVAEKLGKNSFLSSIGITIAGAIVLVWLPLLFAYAFGTPTDIRIGGIAFVVIAALAYGYFKRNLTVKDYSLYQDQEQAKGIKKEDDENRKLAYQTLKIITMIVVGVFVITGIFGGTKEIKAAQVEIVSNVVETAHAVDKQYDRGVKAFGDMGDEPTTSTANTLTSPKEDMVQCGSRTIKASKVRKDMDTLGRGYCTPTMTTYPCNCNMRMR